MRVSLNWLKDFVEIEMPPAELAHLLTMNCLEVEAVEPHGQELGDIITGRILSVGPHPDADRLSVCLVDTGRGEVPVVCGAPNAKTGVVAPIAMPGTKLPGGMIVKETRIRGQRSVGMLLAEDEMGLTDDHTGILELPEGTPPGIPVDSVIPLTDWVLEVGITPNRPDCTSIIGIAREIAALTGQNLKHQDIRIEASDPPIQDLASVSVEDPEGCPRYSAGMIQDVDLAPSPFWMRYRLYLCGMRGINNVVDITNYVLLELGQPLHAFDYDRLEENRIIVRRAREGERFTTLDGKSHVLSEDHLMICDGKRPIALAGIMGGLNSEIFAGSRNVLIESACFDPITIRRGSKKLNLSTEASYRFERGVDPENTVSALNRALALMAEFGGGRIAKGVIDIYSRPYKQRTIDLRIDRTNRFLGMELNRDKVAADLEALQLSVETLDDNTLRVRPPAFRMDLEREVDLMEEVARLEGYDRIPVTYPSIRPHAQAEKPLLFINERPRELMAGMGFSEILTYSFISPEALDLLADGDTGGGLKPCVRILNPLTSDQSVMRTSLVPGLLGAVKSNIAHGEETLRLFELGNLFLPREGEELPRETSCLAAVMTGEACGKTWYGEKREVDFFDIKGILESLLKGLRVTGVRFLRGQIPAYFDREISALVDVSGTTAGYIGKITPEVLERYDIKTDNAYLFELHLEVLLSWMKGWASFKPYSRFPAVYRDLSIVVGKEVESASVHDIILREGGELLESVELYDVFEGGKIGSQEKALTFRLRYRSRIETLDGREVNRLHERVMKTVLEKTGGRLREA
ncbi:MAG: phenylalanine--tRNA ligase subunit beta [Deltaproteobacteria bacterium]|nr:phenylalanine--tRNA ligase subunit beta [Deltaproteobacteria bacterium]MBW2303515.1 phenylalanine--tRNA ligase subunit beta [Deltaproteobacteria bacterium]